MSKHANQSQLLTPLITHKMVTDAKNSALI